MFKKRISMNIIYLEIKSELMVDTTYMYYIHSSTSNAPIVLDVGL